MSIKEALTEVEELNAQAFIGPWVLGTCALLSNSAEEAQEYLARADVIVEGGCVGNNYYRFYMEAIESAVIHGDYKCANHYLEIFRGYAVNKEPCPWSDFYLKRGELLLANDELGSKNTDILNLIDTAKSIQLLSANPQLECALKQ